MITNKRVPKKALFLSMIMPGLGQVYNGEVSKGISMFLVFAFSVPIFSWLATHGPNFSLWLLIVVGVLINLSVCLMSAIDAFKRAKKIGDNYQLGPFNKVHVYLSLLFFGYFFVLNQLFMYTRNHVVAMYNIPSTSMSPNLEKGDLIFVDRNVNSPESKRKLKHGDIAIFVYPNDRTTIYVKRIIGLPGDKIEIKGTDVTVNDKTIVEGQPITAGDQMVLKEKAESGNTYDVVWKANSQGSQVTTTVPNGQVFVLGDNRDGASDSRSFGAIPLADVIGVTKQVWFSVGDSGLRLGKWVDVN
jgi:signal peptidase I